MTPDDCPRQCGGVRSLEVVYVDHDGSVVVYCNNCSRESRIPPRPAVVDVNGVVMTDP